ncbi:MULTISPECIES: LuxR C-terminal-related transcriptional regulator [Bradyrhizobium]|uniref:LuxR C-terminal-related transcriptional regulator n=1 Tax=Bradyrhizobium TaxID=374 RepID=UPI001B8A6A96|nr:MULTISPECIES: response regulator transcription factor [Bradyrhizobium]MBR0975129.1 response regulator transcription factor [Bradyrhizobium japonicum]
MSTVTIAVIDDHPLMIEAIHALLRRTKGFEIVGSGTTAYDVIDLCERNQPQVAVVDLSIPGDVYAAIENAIRISPTTKIVAFTAATGVDSAIRALDAGASGYVLKGSNTAELIQAIWSVQSGETYITQSFASRVIAGLRDASLRRKAAQAVILSIRERQIVRLLMNGKTNKEIAIAIKISEKTVKHYMTALMQKLQVRNRLEVVIAAQKFNESRSPVSLHS